MGISTGRVGYRPCDIEEIRVALVAGHRYILQSVALSAALCRSIALINQLLSDPCHNKTKIVLIVLIAIISRHEIQLNHANRLRYNCFTRQGNNIEHCGQA